MKHLIFAIISFLILASCTNATQWEYKIVSIEGESEYEYSNFHNLKFGITNEDLNAYGFDGWELVDVYTTTETKHPNFGDDKYVTGIRENTRTSTVNFVFKRPFTEE